MFAFDYIYIGEEQRKQFKYVPYLNMLFVAFAGSIVGGGFGTFVGGFFGSLTFPVIGTVLGSAMGMVVGTAIGMAVGALLGLGVNWALDYWLPRWAQHLKETSKLRQFLDELLEPGPMLSLGVSAIIGVLIFGTFFGGLLAPGFATLAVALLGAGFTALAGWFFTAAYKMVGDVQDDTALIGTTTAMFGATVGFVVCTYLGFSGVWLFTGVVAATLVCGISMALFYAIWNHRISQLYNRFIHADRLATFMEQREERAFLMKFVGKTTGIIFAALGVALAPFIISGLGISLTVGWASAIGATVGFVLGWPCGWLFDIVLPEGSIPPDLKVAITFSTVLGATLGGVFGTFFIPIPGFGQAMGTTIGSLVGSVIFGVAAFGSVLICRPKGRGYSKEDFNAYHPYHHNQHQLNSSVAYAVVPIKGVVSVKDKVSSHSSNNNNLNIGGQKNAGLNRWNPGK